MLSSSGSSSNDCIIAGIIFGMYLCKELPATEDSRASARALIGGTVSYKNINKHGNVYYKTHSIRLNTTQTSNLWY